MGTVTTAKACMTLSRHWLCIGCQLDPVCVIALVLAVLEMFARQYGVNR